MATEHHFHKFTTPTPHIRRIVSSSVAIAKQTHFAVATMESTVLRGASCFVCCSQHNDRAGALTRNFQVFAKAQNRGIPLLRARNITSGARKRAVISSSLGRKVKKETIIPDPDYRIPIVLLGSAGVFAYVDNIAAAVPFGLLGLLLLVQTTRVRFVFDDEALEVKIGDQLQESGENVFVGGRNRWKYSTFVNWELWWPNFPILVYFKEVQTKPDGQIHFFPVIFNGKQLYDAMVERCGPSKTSGPK